MRGGRRLETATEQTTLNFFSHLTSCVLLLLVYDVKLYYKAISPEESEASSLSFQNLPPPLLSPARKAAPAPQLASRYVIRRGKKVALHSFRTDQLYRSATVLANSFSSVLAIPPLTSCMRWRRRRRHLFPRSRSGAPTTLSFPPFPHFLKPVFRFSLRASRRFPQTKPGRERGYKNRGKRRRRGELEEKGFPLQKPSSPSCKGRFHSTVFNAPPSVLPLSPTNQPSILSAPNEKAKPTVLPPLLCLLLFSFLPPPISFSPSLPSRSGLQESFLGCCYLCSLSPPLKWYERSLMVGLPCAISNKRRGIYFISIEQSKFISREQARISWGSPSLLSRKVYLDSAHFPSSVN